MSYVLHEELTCKLQGPVSDKEFIAIHWYGTPGQTGDVHATARYLANADHASINYVTAAGVVYCLVSQDRVAYGQGDGATGYGNLRGISIENNPHCTPEDRETTAELIAYIRRRDNKNYPLRPHKHFKNTACPGVWEQWMPWLDKRANEINAARAGQPAPAPAAPVTPSKPAAPVPVAPAQGNGSGPGYCIVEPGDSLSGIAKQFGKSLDRIIALNPGINPGLIHPGQKVYLLNHCFVESGDTLSGIAKQFGFSLQVVKSANPGINHDRLSVGQVIYLE